MVALAREGTTLTATNFAALPRYMPPPPRPAPFAAMLYLAVLTTAVGAMAARRFTTIKLA
jgi:hypothetical protein